MKPFRELDYKPKFLTLKEDFPGGRAAGIKPA